MHVGSLSGHATSDKPDAVQVACTLGTWVEPAPASHRSATAALQPACCPGCLRSHARGHLARPASAARGPGLPSALAGEMNRLVRAAWDVDLRQLARCQLPARSCTRPLGRTSFCSTRSRPSICACSSQTGHLTPHELVIAAQRQGTLPVRSCSSPLGSPSFCSTGLRHFIFTRRTRTS